MEGQRTLVLSAMHYHVVRCWGGNIWVPFQICSPVIGRSKKLLQTIIFQFLVDLPRQGSNWRFNRTKIFDVVLITNNAGFVIVNSLLISNTWSSGIYLNFVVIKWFNDRNMRRNLPFDYKHYKQDDAGSGSGRVLISPTVNNFSSKIFPNNCLVRWDKW